MVPLCIKRYLDPNVDAKHALRTHVDRLPLKEQMEFAAFALQLLAERGDTLPTDEDPLQFMSWRSYRSSEAVKN